MLSFPNAKINIGLNITARRQDGYHELETIMVPVGWRDVLEIVPGKSTETTLTLSGNPIACTPEKNIVMKAYRALAEKVSLPPVDIYLRKIIPDGAGLGGGSADASFTLSSLNTLLALDMTDQELAKIAAAIGADCPLFIYNRPMLATGIGTTLTPIDMDMLRGLTVVIIKPQFSISTAEAYANVIPKPATTPLDQLVRLPIRQWKDHIFNDFEQSLRNSFPMIDRIKAKLYDCGAVYASLSGSGSAVYGIFDNDKMAEPAKQQFPDCLTFSTSL